MTKSVFSNDMVAHIWAQKNQFYGRSNNGNFYFDGATLYSYGTHFIVGYHLPDNGPTLLNTDGYSISTSGHKTDAWRACRHLQTIDVPKLTELVERLKRSRDAKSLRATVRTYCQESAINGTLGKDSMLALLTYVGIPQSIDKIMRDAAKIRVKNRANDEKRARIVALATLRNATSKSEAQWYKSLADVVVARPYVTVQSVTVAESKLIRQAMRTLTKAGMPVKLWNASQHTLKLIAGMESRLESDKPRASQRQRVRQLINGYRRSLLRISHHWEALAMARNGEQSGHIWSINESLRNVQSSLAYICNHESGYLPASTRDKARDAVAPLQVAIDGARVTYDTTRATERAESARLAALSQEESRLAWHAGLRSNWHGSKPNGAAYLRATGVERDSAGNVINGTLETSQGATVPLVAAIRAFRFVKLVKERGEPWHRNGQTLPVGHFQIDRIETTGNFRAGCHAIDWQEIEALATELGVFALPADSAAIVA